MSLVQDQLTLQYLNVLLNELPEDVYADSGDVVNIGGTDYPKELHKRLLLVKASAFAKADLLLKEVGLESNVLTCTDASIDLWEDRFLERRRPEDSLATRQGRVARVMRLRGNLFEDHLEALILEEVGYFVDLQVLQGDPWELETDVPTSELGTNTFLGGLEFHIVVRLVTTETQDVIDRIDRLLTRIEPARCTHHIDNNTGDFVTWELAFGSLGINTHLL